MNAIDLLETLKADRLAPVFSPAIHAIIEQQPIAGFVIGSNADAVWRDDLSDLDLIFLWPDDRVLDVVAALRNSFATHPLLFLGYFGPQIQFGHLLCFRPHPDFSTSLDVGIMSFAYYRNYLPPTHRRLLFGSPPNERHAPPERRIYLLFHTLGQCLKAVRRDRIIYAMDYLGRARTSLALILSQPDDADGMRRSTFNPAVEQRLLQSMGPVDFTSSSLLAAVESILAIAQATLPDADSLFVAFRKGFQRYGLK